VDAEFDTLLEELELPAATWGDSDDGAPSTIVDDHMLRIESIVPRFSADSTFSSFRPIEKSPPNGQVGRNRSAPRGVVLRYTNNRFYGVLPGIQPGERDRVVAVPISVAFALLTTFLGFVVFLTAWRYYQRTFGHWP
jgi:hypothetical protein